MEMTNGHYFRWRIPRKWLGLRYLHPGGDFVDFKLRDPSGFNPSPTFRFAKHGAPGEWTGLRRLQPGEACHWHRHPANALEIEALHRYAPHADTPRAD